MSRLQELGLTNEGVGEALDYATMQDQMGSYAEPLQPGDYRFRFPADVTAVWETFDHEKGKPPGKRIRARFDSTHPLTIIAGGDGSRVGEPFETSITNAERKRGKADDPTAQLISDMDYFNRDVFKLPTKPKTNVEYAQVFMQHAPSKEFSAEVTWNWFCNPKKNIRVPNGAGGYQEMEQAGCGTSYYQKDVDKQPVDPNDPSKGTEYPLRVACACGAHVRAFANLQNFRA